MGKLILICLIGFHLISCRHEPIVPDNPQISFAGDVNPILIGNCTQSGCHGGIDPEKFSLVGYDNVVKHENIVPGKPHSSKIYESITTYNNEEVMPRKIGRAHV